MLGFKVFIGYLYKLKSDKISIYIVLYQIFLRSVQLLLSFPPLEKYFFDCPFRLSSPERRSFPELPIVPLILHLSLNLCDDSFLLLVLINFKLALQNFVLIKMLFPDQFQQR